MVKPLSTNRVRRATISREQLSRSKQIAQYGEKSLIELANQFQINVAVGSQNVEIDELRVACNQQARIIREIAIFVFGETAWSAAVNS